MSGISCVCLLIFGIVAIVNAVPNNCSSQYQAALQQVLDLKETCREAVFKDCCEVSKLPLDMLLLTIPIFIITIFRLLRQPSSVLI